MRSVFRPNNQASENALLHSPSRFYQETNGKKLVFPLARTAFKRQVKPEDYTVRVPVMKPEEFTYTVCVPHAETITRNHTVTNVVSVTKTRMVRHCVPVSRTKTVTCDNGHWETQVCEVPASGGCGSACGGCGTRTANKRVWVPNVQTEEVTVVESSCENQEIKYTAFEQVCESVPYLCTYVSYRPEQRTGTRQVCSYEP